MRLTIDEYDGTGTLQESHVIHVTDRDDASAKLYRWLSGYRVPIRARAMARFGDGESKFSVIETGRITRFTYNDRPEPTIKIASGELFAEIDDLAPARRSAFVTASMIREGQASARLDGETHTIE